MDMAKSFRLFLSHSFSHIILVYFQDLNECNEVGQGGCDQGCRNTIGGHDCFCEAGYTLNADGTSCDGKYLPI